MLPFLLGLATGLSLIVAIGAQNAFVLRTGLAAGLRTIAAVVLVCAASDAVLISAGVAGVGAVVEAVPAALVVIRVIGSVFLIGYGLLAARRALRPQALVVDGAGGERAGGAGQSVSAGTGPPFLRTAVLTALALTWLNPHVYLDTIVFLGSVATRQGDARWIWAAGAVAASCLWFAGLGFGARRLRGLFASPAAWRVLDAAIAVVMVALGLRLALGL